MTDIAAYGGLFAISFLAATFFPAQSEIMLTGLLVGGDFSVVGLIVVASIGNTLGSVVNWAIGLQVDRFKHKRWFPATPEQLDRASTWYRKYGYWSLLMSWAPFIGDPLTLAAGILREPFWTFLLLVAIAKTGRYIIVTAVTLGILQF